MIKVISKAIPKEFCFLLSGGVDSIVASYWLNKHYKNINFKVVHFNHNVQSANSLMEQSVKSFCEHVLHKDLIVIHRNDSHSDLTENGLRQFRLDFMGSYGGNFVTAHHLDDAVENYLMNCLSGCPEHKPINEITFFDEASYVHPFSICHPFVKNRKSVLEDYAFEHDLMRYVVVDPTNGDNKMKRNWVRNEIIPMVVSRDLGIHKVVLKKFYV